MPSNSGANETSSGADGEAGGMTISSAGLDEQVSPALGRGGG